MWFNAEPLALGRNYLIKHNVRTVARARPRRFAYRVNMQTLERDPARELKMNDIARGGIRVREPAFLRPYDRNRTTGSFILIDPISNATVGAAHDSARPFGASSPARRRPARAPKILWKMPVAAADRYARHGHQPAVILVEGRPRLAEYLESALFAEGFEVLLVSAADVPAGHLDTLLKLARQAGLVVILSAESADGATTSGAGRRWRRSSFFDLGRAGFAGRRRPSGSCGAVAGECAAHGTERTPMRTIVRHEDARHRRNAIAELQEVSQRLERAEEALRWGLCAVRHARWRSLRALARKTSC